MPVTFPRVPDKADAKYLAFTGVRKDDPVDFAVNPTTDIDAKFLLKPVQDEILNLIDLSAASRRTLACVQHTGADQVAPSGSQTVVAFSASVYDPSGLFSAGTITVPYSGIYSVGARMHFAAQTGGFRHLIVVRQRGPSNQTIAGITVPAPADAVDVYLCASGDIDCEPGDHIVVMAAQNSGADVAIVAPQLWVHLVGKTL